MVKSREIVQDSDGQTELNEYLSTYMVTRSKNKR